MIRDKSPHLADRNIKICVYTIEEEVPAVIEETFQRSRFFDEGRYDEEDPPFFWEAGHWGVKRGDNLICFAAERNNISFEGLWQVEGLIDTGGIIAVEPTPNLFGKEVKARDSGKICRMVRSLIENGEIRADMAPMPILDFALLTDQL
ncbi:hypothetical protein ASD67_10775 [Sphingopyxis sp. Root1497]|nr:hypothetical protein ASD67_10775 [Sphingopyxis sp. Root1497]